MYLELEKLINNLVTEHQTTDPFKIAKERNITIFTKNLGDVKGFYKKILRRKYIFINSNLSRIEKIIVCGHELGHAILHNTKGLQFMLEHGDLIKRSVLEDEANDFSLSLFFYGNDNCYNVEEYNNLKKWVQKMKNC